MQPEVISLETGTVQPLLSLYKYWSKLLADVNEASKIFAPIFAKIGNFLPMLYETVPCILDRMTKFYLMFYFFSNAFVKTTCL